MAATYDPTLASDADRARLMLSDTDVANALLQDEEINAQLAVFGFNEGVAQLADALAVRFARMATETGEAGGLTFKFGDRVKAYQELAKRLRSQQAPNGPATTTAVSGVISAPATNNLRL